MSPLKREIVKRKIQEVAEGRRVGIQVTDGRSSRRRQESEYAKPKFRNEALTDFSKEENVRPCARPSEKVKSQLGRRVSAGDWQRAHYYHSKLESINPATSHAGGGVSIRRPRTMAKQRFSVAHRNFSDVASCAAGNSAPPAISCCALLRERKHEMSAG